MNGPLSHRWPAATAGVALLAVSGSGLTAHVADKTGSDTVVLHLATIDGDVNPSGMYNAPQVFVDSLESVSGGQLQVDVTTTYDDGAPDAESRLVESIASGSVDGGWPATRAFANAGIDGLQAIEAPMTITNFAAEKELVSSSTADTVLAQLEGSGVVGLGLGVGPLRRPFAADAPLLAAADWAGARFRGLQLSRPGRRRHRTRRGAGEPRGDLGRPAQRWEPARRRIRHRAVLREAA